MGRGKHVKESDIRNLLYLQAIVNETLRLYLASPFVIRSLLEDCTLSGGYNIPANTRVMVNVWKVHRDERVWPNPRDFEPERFLSSHEDVEPRGQSFELIHFSSGRRSCPEISMALKMVHIALTSFL